MIEFFEDYQYEIIYIIVTIISVVALRFLTTFVQKRALKRSVEKLHYQSDGTLKTVRRILTTLRLVLGIIALALLFVSPEVNKTLIDNSKFIIYTQIVTFPTLDFASTIHKWFKWKVN